MTQSERIKRFTRGIWDWFARNKRSLPWRDLKEKDDNRRAYLVLVSEIMLQQTQVSRVIILYKEFIRKFSLIEDLAKASNSEILIAWRGLGYNNRALRLRDAARTIVTEKGGGFPRSLEELQPIPGIGHYTASAVLNFAFGIPSACLDTNIRRILHRFFVGPENPDGTWKKDERYLLKLAEEVLHCALGPSPRPARRGTPLHRDGEGPGARTSDWHAALMDFGSLVCTKNSPKWELFSEDLKSSCMAYGKEIKRTKNMIKKEPGRLVAGRFIPNRIFRGRIIETLRDVPEGLPLDHLGSRVAIDWTMGDHREWLALIIESLGRDGMIEKRRGRFMLAGRS